MKSTFKNLANINTVQGICPKCQEEVILLSIVEDFYRCTNCGEDTKQYVNGSIKYIKLDETDAEWLRKNRL